MSYIERVPNRKIGQPKSAAIRLRAIRITHCEIERTAFDTATGTAWITVNELSAVDESAVRAA
jgi:hypothetical protein